MGERVLLIGVYGMELVECGGALAANVAAGGTSYATLMLSAYGSRKDVEGAAAVLGVENPHFLDFRNGFVDVDEAHKRALVQVIRTVKPTIVITQDPEHSLPDLDPDRRPAMTLILEALGLASRTFAADDGLPPHPVPTLYYMTPSRPNCVVDITPHWRQKVDAMDLLESQMEFSGRHWAEHMTPEALEALAPGFASLDSDVERGRVVHRVLDRAVHIYHGIGHHGHYAFAEAYRREGNFHLPALIR
jgi:LmbE family N-acetylglucosaminyl deacetylase